MIPIIRTTAAAALAAAAVVVSVGTASARPAPVSDEPREGRALVLVHGANPRACSHVLRVDSSSGRPVLTTYGAACIEA